MAGRQVRWHAAGLLVVAVMSGLLGVLVHALGGLSWLEQRSINARFAVRGHAQASSQAVIVGLDTNSYIRLPLPPLPRRLDARLIDRLHQAGARVIAFDFALERPSVDAGGDFALVDSLRRAAPAVVSVTAIRVDGRTEPLAGRVGFDRVRGVYPGVTLLPVDGDGAIRRFPGQFGGVDSFAAVGARLYQGSLARELAVPSGALINYPGGPGTVKALSFYDLLQGRFDPALVRGKVVVVGPTTAVLQDLHQTPMGGGPMSGSEIQADAITTALGGFPLRYAPAGLTTILLLALGLVVPLLSLRLGVLWVVLLGAVAVLAWSVAAQLAFNAGTVLDYSDGLFVLLASTGGAWGLATLADARERRRLRELFAASSPEVVKGVLATPAPGPRTLTATDVIAGYRLDEVIGHGGMGVVYKAHQLHLDRPVALKLIVPQYAHDSSYRERFERESRIAASIGHANVIPVFDAGEDDGLLYIVMQLVDGIDLDKLLRGLGPLEPAEAVRVLEQLASALDAAHGRGLVHRDVKPANVLIGSNNSQQVCLTDFGLAKYAEATSVVREIEQWAGTIDYLAPEQIEGGPVDRRADIYALTAVFYHCLTGLIPFARDSDAAKLWAHINAPRPSAADARRGVPPAIDHVIARGMAKSPDERYESAGGLAAAAAAVFGLRATRIGLSPDRIAGFPPQGDNVPTRDAGPTV